MTESVLERLLRLLTERQADFQALRHEPARTSEEAARVRGTPLEQGAKALVFQADERVVLLVAQAHRRVDTRAFKRAHGVKNLRMLAADELLARTGLEVGAVPPFGSLLGFPTYADERLLALPRIVFNAGSRSTSVLLATADYARIERPEVGRFASEEPGAQTAPQIVSPRLARQEDAAHFRMEAEAVNAEQEAPDAGV